MILQDDITIRVLSGEPGDMRALQRVIEEAPTYARLVTGVPPGPAEAQSTYTILPEGKSYDDKFVFGIYLGDCMVGCADVIRGFPNSATAHIGLLLISESVQGKGVGSAGLKAIEEIIRSWGGCNSIRIGVIRTNDRVLPFWTKQGFAETGEIKPYHYGTVDSEAIILTKRLQ